MARHGIAALLLAALAPGPARADADGPAPPPGFVDRSGLKELVFWQGVNGLFAGSLLATAVTAGAIRDHCQTTYGPNEEPSKACKDARGRAGGIAALGLAAGIATPLLVTRDRDVRTGDVILVNRATLLGLMHGYVIPFAAGLDNTDLDDVRVLSALTFTGDVAGLAIGAYLATRTDLAPGQISLVGTLHSATFIAAMTVGNSFPETVTQRDERVIAAVSLGLADVALGLGIAYLDRIDVGRRRVFWLDTGAVVGWIGGGGFGALLGGSSKQAIAIGSTVGMAAGIALTYWATSDMEPWRRRHEAGPVALDPPALRVEPDPALGTTRVSVDALRGRF